MYELPKNLIPEYMDRVTFARLGHLYRSLEDIAGFDVDEELWGAVGQEQLWAPRVVDPIESGFARAALPELFIPNSYYAEHNISIKNAGRLVQPIAEIFKTKGPHVLTDLVLRASEFGVHNQMRNKLPSDIYPTKEFRRPEVWRDEYRVFEWLDYDQLELEASLPLQACWPEAYFIYKVLLDRAKHRWSTAPVVVDVGTSEGSGPIKMTLNKQFPFRAPVVIQDPNPNLPVTIDLQRDWEVQNVISRFTHSDPNIDHIFGCDILPILPGDVGAHNRVISHTYPFSESLRNPEGIEQLNKLSMTSSDRFTLIKKNIDITNPGSIATLGNELPNGKPQVFIVSGVFFEMPAQDARNALNMINDLSNEGDLIIVSEVADVTTDGQIRLEGATHGLKIKTRRWWQIPGSFSTFVFFAGRPEILPLKICSHLTRSGKALWASKEGRQIILGDRPL